MQLALILNGVALVELYMSIFSQPYTYCSGIFFFSWQQQSLAKVHIVISAL